MKPLDLPVRKRLKKNYHLCEQCGREYYRRTGNDPKRVTRFCNQECRNASTKPDAPEQQSAGVAAYAPASQGGKSTTTTTNSKILRNSIPTPIAADLIKPITTQIATPAHELKNASKTKLLSSFIPTPVAADLVGYSRDYVAELARTGQIAAVKGEGRNERWRVSLDSLEKYAQKLYPVSKVAKFVGYSASQVRRLALASKVEAKKEGRN